ncbi:hypothetical protein SSX86_032433, partial [Deinandra increscens subsp. villosa]
MCGTRYGSFFDIVCGKVEHEGRLDTPRSSIVLQRCCNTHDEGVEVATGGEVVVATGGGVENLGKLKVEAFFLFYLLFLVPAVLRIYHHTMASRFNYPISGKNGHLSGSSPDGFEEVVIATILQETVHLAIDDIWQVFKLQRSTLMNDFFRTAANIE